MLCVTITIPGRTGEALKRVGVLFSAPGKWLFLFEETFSVEYPAWYLFSIFEQP
jgi:hypothetical protein